MGLFVLDVVIRILGIRAHIPQHDDFHGAPHGSSLTAGGTWVRILIAAVASLAGLALLLWAAVWLAIRFL